MRYKLYYFTGTGNSLKVARDLAAQLAKDDAEVNVLPLAAGIPEQENSPEEAIGIVFPVYAWGMPLLVRDFVRKIPLSSQCYIFAVATCAGSVGGTLRETAQILKQRGLELACGFAVLQPNNYIIFSGADSSEKQKQIIGQGELRSAWIAEQIRGKRRLPPEKSGILTNILGLIVRWGFRATLKRQAKNFRADEKCDLCQICIRICPVGNISLKEGKITWGASCEQCLACLQWCPAEAIQFKRLTEKRERYHHPEIGLAEMLDKKRGESNA